MDKKGELWYAIYRTTAAYRRRLHKRIEGNFEEILKKAKEKQEKLSK